MNCLNFRDPRLTTQLSIESILESHSDHVFRTTQRWLTLQPQWPCRGRDRRRFRSVNPSKHRSQLIVLQASASCLSRRYSKMVPQRSTSLVEGRKSSMKSPAHWATRSLGSSATSPPSQICRTWSLRLRRTLGTSTCWCATLVLEDLR